MLCYRQGTGFGNWRGVLYLLVILCVWIGDALATVEITGGHASFGVDLGCTPDCDIPPDEFSLNVFYDEADLITRPNDCTDNWHGWGNICWNVSPGRIEASGSHIEGCNQFPCDIGRVYGRGHAEFSVTFTLDSEYGYTAAVSGQVTGIMNGTHFLPAGVHTIKGQSVGDDGGFFLDVQFVQGMPGCGALPGSKGNAYILIGDIAPKPPSGTAAMWILYHAVNKLRARWTAMGYNVLIRGSANPNSHTPATVSQVRLAAQDPQAKAVGVFAHGQSDIATASGGMTFPFASEAGEIPGECGGVAGIACIPDEQIEQWRASSGSQLWELVLYSCNARHDLDIAQNWHLRPGGAMVAAPNKILVGIPLSVENRLACPEIPERGVVAASRDYTPYLLMRSLEGEYGDETYGLIGGLGRRSLFSTGNVDILDPETGVGLHLNVTPTDSVSVWFTGYHKSFHSLLSPEYRAVRSFLMGASDSLATGTVTIDYSGTMPQWPSDAVEDSVRLWRFLEDQYVPVVSTIDTAANTVAFSWNSNASLQDEYVVSVPQAHAESIKSVGIPPSSNDGHSHPLNDDVWVVSAPPYPISTTIGIGNIVRESITLEEFSFLDHVYTSPHVPDSLRAAITYEFTCETTIKEIEIVQHANGVTQIEGFVGDSVDSLVSVGAVFGPRGDVTGSTVFTEGERSVFDFGNELPGRVFRVVLRKTSLSNGYALYRVYPRDGFGARVRPAIEECPTPSDYENRNEQTPSLDISQNYPNPFNPVTKIQFSLPLRDHVKLRIYDGRGRLVKTLVDGIRPEGHHEVIWRAEDDNGRRVASGVYLYLLETERGTRTRKMALVR